MPLPPTEISVRKAVQYFLFENWISFGKTIGLCYFGHAPRFYMLLPDILAAIQSVTDWIISIAKLLKIGERGTNMARIFSQRERLGPTDDMLPGRFFPA